MVEKLDRDIVLARVRAEIEVLHRTTNSQILSLEQIGALIPLGESLGNDFLRKLRAAENKAGLKAAIEQTRGQAQLLSVSDAGITAMLVAAVLADRLRDQAYSVLAAESFSTNKKNLPPFIFFADMAVGASRIPDIVLLAETTLSARTGAENIPELNSLSFLTADEEMGETAQRARADAQEYAEF